MTIGKQTARRVLVLGAYGLIGAGIARALAARGHHVTGLGRDRETAHRVLPGLDWVIRDLRDLQNAHSWRPVLDGVEVVVNAAGALQDGGKDDLAAVHQHAIAALARAAAGAGVALVQISAVGADPGAATRFMATKGLADQAVTDSGARHWILRPGLVIAQTAYGGTQLIRMLAAMPLVQPIARAQVPVQCVSLDAIADAVAMAVEGDLSAGLCCDLVEQAPQSLARVVAAHREWLGLGPGRQVPVPEWVLRPVAWGADLLGRLGWRSPLRSTAVRVLADGVVGDPGPWRAAAGCDVAPLAEVLGRLPAAAEHRLAARMALLAPVVIATLAVFWLASGAIGVISLDKAARTLTEAGWGHGLARASVLFWAVVDVALAAAVMVRRSAPLACLGMIAVSLFYLIAASVVTPALWLDPLGPLVKVLPGIVLAAVARALLETR